jgi:hypothetical protein
MVVSRGVSSTESLSRVPNWVPQGGTANVPSTLSPKRVPPKGSYQGDREGHIKGEQQKGIPRGDIMWAY